MRGTSGTSWGGSGWSLSSAFHCAAIFENAASPVA